MLHIFESLGNFTLKPLFGVIHMQFQCVETIRDIIGMHLTCVLYMNGVKRVNPESSHHKENRFFFLYLQFSSVQLLSHVRLFVTP